ncbi:beta-ketoacyl synthase N-terminal-like domain-containing protein, partial [Desulfobacterales bacterium HSG2]|nr:beta-ketoacyl synthase N-terminal-like domain-containing protein [Desulfobacterales bacterium HSG2]
MKENEQKYRHLLKNAVLKLDKMQSRINAMKNRQSEPIAIIGMGCRFPGGADSPDAYWNMLRNGTDAITEVPAWRWDVNEYCASETDMVGKIANRHGGFLDQPDLFDPEFFSISPREAVTMDPQQRMLLEVTWEALEYANVIPENLFKTATGVFVGISCFDYALHILGPGYDDRADAYSGTGVLLSPASGRLSYVLGLTGPSMSVDTACSSSLLAVHLACQSLRSGESDMALAGGVNVFVSPGLSVAFSRAGMLSPEGRCKAFDSSANGYVRSEGCGMIVLRRLSDALKQGDHILGLVRGSAVNQDGASGALTAPSGPSQEEVVRSALENAGIAPSSVGYIEAHGTGTSLGDPIEMIALGNVLCKDRSPDQPLIVGSVKTNIGHSEPASGVAGIIKILLSMRHKEIPPHLHLKTPNPHIPWDSLPVQVPDRSLPWRKYDGKRIAGVNSFGFSGTNVHVVLEAYNQDRKTTSSSVPVRHPQTCLLTLSTRTDAAIKEMAKLYAAYLSDNPDVSLEDICFTANACRSQFSHRLAIVAASRDEMRERLLLFASDEKRENTSLLYYGEVRKDSETITPAMEVMEQFNDAGDAFSHLAALYVKENTVDWKDFEKTFHPNRVILPTYPFQRQRYWIEDMSSDTRRKDQSVMDASGDYHPLIGKQLNLPSSDEVRFEVSFSSESPTYLNEHRLFNRIVVPGAAHISMVLTALEKAFRNGAYQLRDLVFPEALLINETGNRKPETGNFSTVQLVLSPLEKDQTYSFRILSSEQNEEKTAPWRTHCTGIAESPVSGSQHPASSIQHPASSIQPISGNAFYADYEPTGYGWGPSFQWLEDIQKHGEDAFCRIRPPELSEKTEIYALYPGLIDSWFHLLFNCRENEHAEMTAGRYIYVPFHVDAFTLHNIPESYNNLRAYAKIGNGGESISGDLFLTDDNDELIAEVVGLELRKMREFTFLRNLYPDIRKWAYKISWIPSEPLSPAEQPENRGAWMIFADTRGVGSELAELLREAGERPVLITPGYQYDKTDTDHYHISPESPEDFNRLFREVWDSHALKGLVHLWSLDSMTTEASNAASLQNAQVMGCQSVLYLLQSLISTGPRPPSGGPGPWDAREA